jgi:hypothetical protein
MQRGTKKYEATKLRLKGYSYNEIRDRIGIPKSTLSGWFKDLVLSKKALDRLEARHGIGTEILVKRNKMQTHLAHQRAAKMQSKGKNRIGSLTKHELLHIGVALYWGEGYKKLAVKNGKEVTAHNISFTNADPSMVRMFVRFLIEVLGVDKSKILIDVRLYSHMNENKTLDYWLLASGLPKENMRNPTHHVSVSSRRKLPYNRLPYGTARIQVNDTRKFHFLLGMIEGMKKQL